MQFWLPNKGVVYKRSSITRCWLTLKFQTKFFQGKKKNNNCQHITPVFENVERRFYNCIHWIASQWAYFSTSTNFRCLNEETSNQFGLVPSNKRTTRLNRHGLCKGTSVIRCWMLLRQKSKSPPTIRSGLYNPLNYKTGYSTHWTFQNRSNYPLGRFWTVVLPQ